MGFTGAAIIVDLLERLERLEAELARSRGCSQGPTKGFRQLNRGGAKDMDPNRLAGKAREVIRQAQSLAQRLGLPRSMPSIWPSPF